MMVESGVERMMVGLMASMTIFLFAPREPAVPGEVKVKVAGFRAES